MGEGRRASKPGTKSVSITELTGEYAQFAEMLSRSVHMLQLLVGQEPEQDELLRRYLASRAEDEHRRREERVVYSSYCRILDHVKYER